MVTSLPNQLYTCSQTRAIDQHAINQCGLLGSVLMKRAARAAFDCARHFWPQNREWTVLCGAGNNAGDGYAYAALAKQKGHNARVYYVKDPATLKNEALKAFEYAAQEGVEILPFQQITLPTDGVVVDALLGTGLSGEVTGLYQQAIDWINQAALPVFSMDIPSGLCGDSGTELGQAVKATATATFVGVKRGLLTAKGPARVGQLFFSDLGIPKEAYAAVSEPSVSRLQRSFCTEALSERPADAHKGTSGHLMVVGGELGFGGAAILSSECAAFSGCGMVTLCTRHEHVAAALVRRPELMVRGIPSGQELEPVLSRADVLLVGPGLGQTPWSEQMLQQAVVTELPMVLDADALNILAQGNIPWPKKQPVIITPHPGEAARLLNVSTADVQKDRFKAAAQLQKLCGGIVVLKGAGTIIHDGETCWLANVGNAGLATSGSGDVLGGVIGALLAQGLSAIDAVKLAVCVHGDAADLLCDEVGTRGMLAAELIPYIRELLVA